MKVTLRDVFQYSQNLLAMQKIDFLEMTFDEIKQYDEFLKVGLQMTKMEFEPQAEKYAEKFKEAVINQKERFDDVKGYLLLKVAFEENPNHQVWNQK